MNIIITFAVSVVQLCLFYVIYFSAFTGTYQHIIFTVLLLVSHGAILF